MNPQNCVFLVFTMSRKRNGWVRNNICTLYLVIWPYCLQKISNWLMSVEDIASQSSVVCETRYTAWLKNHTVSGVDVHVSPGSAETLVRRGGIANHHLIAYFLSKTCGKNYQNRWSYCVQHQCRFLRHSVVATYSGIKTLRVQSSLLKIINVQNKYVMW